jgi:hypothetical protein
LEGFAEEICCSDAAMRQNEGEKIKARISQIEKENGEHNLKMKEAK